jgi:hypothetical protein
MCKSTIIHVVVTTAHDNIFWLLAFVDVICIPPCSQNVFCFEDVNKGGVAILVLGLRPKQGLAKVRAKKEARKSHLMFPRV